MSNPNTIEAGRDAVVLPPGLVVTSASRPETEANSDDPLRAAVGAKNGLILGLAFWVSAYLLWSLVSHFV